MSFRSIKFLQSSSTDPASKDWGWLPLLSVVTALSLFWMAYANNGSRNGAEWATNPTLYWIRYLIIFVPISIRALVTNVSRKERIGLVLLLGIALYMVKVLYSPLDFKFSDELQHWRSTFEILQSESLFQPNPLLPVSPSYPGLQNTTVAVVQLSGLSIFEAGIIVIGVGRIVFSLALFLFYEEVSGSSHIAVLGTILYAINPHYLYFTAFFIYQALALPLTALVLYTIARQEGESGYGRIGVKPLTLVGIVAITVTHHVTSYAFFLFLVFWTIMAYVVRRSKPNLSIPKTITAFAAVVILGWMVYVAIITINYLEPQIGRGITELIGIVSGEESAQRTFKPPERPAIEIYIAYVTILLIFLSFLPGLWYIWQKYRTNIFVVSFGVGSLGYPASLMLRLTSQGDQFTGRTWTFVFMMVVFVIALGVVEFLKTHPYRLMRHVIFPFIFGLFFIGGMISGFPPPWDRMPGPFAIGARQRSIDDQVLASAWWAHDHLEPNQVMAADFTNAQLMGSYGLQDATNYVPELFFTPSLSSFERGIITERGIRYIVVDLRTSQFAPLSGAIYTSWERILRYYSIPIQINMLTKFNTFEGINRPFDSGNIIIYEIVDVGADEG